MKKILLLLAKGFETYEASVFIDVFAWNSVYGNKYIELMTCGITKEIKSTFNLHVKTDILVKDVNADNIRKLMGFIKS